MKSICSIAILLLVFFQVSMKPIILLNWKINQDLITAKYCENKDRPMMHCDGKCYLAKQLRKLDIEEKQERSKHPFPSEKLKQAELVFISLKQAFFLISEEIVADMKNTASVEMANNYRFDFIANCFHPPKHLF